MPLPPQENLLFVSDMSQDVRRLRNPSSQLARICTVMFCIHLFLVLLVPYRHDRSRLWSIGSPYSRVNNNVIYTQRKKKATPE
ncbi:MAG: hypothetical protein [Circular genetic element sp.]|nr:MAG: hypothetical protein [Circular genetic element sp.]